MKGILQKTDLAGRILQWVVELSEFDLKYEAQTAIKSRYLADFVAEYTDTPENPIDWNLYVDGSSNKAGSGADVILESDQGIQLELSLRFEFPASNNQAEYEALLADKKEAKRLIREAQYYTISHDVLYRRGISTPLLKCVPNFATKEVLEEVHSGMCSNHLGARALSKKDNGTQFTDTGFKNMVADLKIKHQFTSVEHPQANGLAEAANKVILAGLKCHLQDAKVAWVEELPQVLWAYRTIPYSTTGESSFRHAYGMETMIPVEVGERSPKVIFYNDDTNSQAQRK
ncbi:uncharacterized protein LOC110272078 [Arachis ipaensis]|uniref:uncharacterized protein LOC110272078 n=1 Tax=Arachis ipaensis TaxID=130454 RepID=UPI000A2B7E1C|nr:uncharacterized protein LOC110272078 [Arachis ipaensis]